MQLGGDTEEPTEILMHPFEAYFAKNWDSCRHMWCSFECQNAVTHGNDTNKIEASWKQLKELVDSFMGVDERKGIFGFSVQSSAGTQSKVRPRDPISVKLRQRACLRAPLRAVYFRYRSHQVQVLRTST
ncbi:hypothetical protein GQ600_24400 [Phytophthora cactorum]|nr:hypothetical protein GQ600_24400 [Phytophthora cactorum]